MFFFKPKKIHVDCFTASAFVAEHLPIQKAFNFMPTWWKNLPSSYNRVDAQTGINIKQGTMKTCAGFVELYKTGLILPLWSDLAVKIFPDNYSYNFAAGNTGVVAHDPVQYGYNFKDRVHFKVYTPWRLKEKTGVKFFYTGCTWAMLQAAPKATVLDGVIDFKYQVSVNINFFFERPVEPYQCLIEAGTPLVQIVPLSEKRVEPHIHLVTQQELDRINERDRYPSFFHGYINKLKYKIEDK